MVTSVPGFPRSFFTASASVIPLVVSSSIWDKIPADSRTQLEAAAQKLTRDYDEEFRGADARAIEVMRQHGLKVHSVPAAARSQWRALTEQGIAAYYAKRFDFSYYETAKSYLEDYRKGAQ